MEILHLNSQRDMYCVQPKKSQTSKKQKQSIVMSHQGNFGFGPTTTNQFSLRNNPIPKPKPRLPFIKVDDSYSNISTASMNSSPKSTISEKSLKIKPIRKAKKKMIWNSSGWLRIYCGPDRSDIACEDPSRVVQIMSTDTMADVVKDMDLPFEYSIWLQIGGGKTRRLQTSECPLEIQEEFLRKLGYLDESRRSRLGIDPDLKYLIRFHIGPAELDNCRGVTKSGTVDILKGLVFPQWKRRAVTIVGTKLIIYPANTCLIPESFELSGAEIYEQMPSYDRLILKVIPKAVEEAGYQNIYNSNISLCSSDRDNRVLFFGFEESWERDLWSTWLTEATAETINNRRMDIGNSGLQTIPEIVLQSTNVVEELLAGQNKLQEIALEALSNFNYLRILRLPGNEFKVFPAPLLQITALTVLDLADNHIQTLPDNISQLQNLEELRIDRNELTEIPNSLRLLRNLKSLQLSQNKIKKLPQFLANMRSLGLVDMYSQKVNNLLHHSIGEQQQQQQKDKQTESNPPLNKISLRSNQLKGSIILGNYGNLTQLDVSENFIENLDLSALDKLENLQCCRNSLIELTVNGKCLTSLIAGNNKLVKLSITPNPTNLRHLDLSYNSLTELPEWLSGCHQLRTLFGSNNQLSSLPGHLFCSEQGTLHTIQLGYNCLKTLPDMPRRKIPLRELFLQNNFLEDLPDNFFFACENLTLLNISSNKLTTLPMMDGLRCQLERIYATDNALTDRVLDSLNQLNHLKVIHAGYNRLTTFPESCAINWPDLEELILSGNKLQHLPENLANLRNLRVLRVHSNQLQTVPQLSKTLSLRVMDLAHNQLDKINLVALLPKKLQFLDLSCNNQLQVDAKQLQVCKSQRQMSLVDVSGKNRNSLPTAPNNYQENGEFDPPWKVGFSETAGNSAKLYISQLRLAGFCNTEGLFGMFDGETNRIIPSFLIKAIPKIMLEERTIKETAADYMKYTLLSAHRELKQQGQKYGISVTLCHISKQSSIRYSPGSDYNVSKKYVLRVASVGESSAILIRQTGCVKLTPCTPNRQIGNSASFPLIVPDPEISEVALNETDEYLVIANKKLWEVLDPQNVSLVVRSEENVILASKKIQDIAQSYGVEDNLSVIVVKFKNLGLEMENVMRELRHNMKKKSGSIITGFCKCGCCCETSNSCCHSGQANQFIRQPSNRSDRSSPSGQSDQTAFEVQNNLKPSAVRLEANGTVSSRRSSNYASNERRSLRGGVVRAVRAKIEEEREKEKEESDSAMSEEQFKCWEYMLEQNTQLLFDKELNTISKAFTKRPLSTTNLSRTQIKALSTSTPQLTLQDQFARNNGYGDYNLTTGSTTNVPFLSKHFGSARSFQPPPPGGNGLFKAMRFNSGRIHPIQGGPNAAYFGSLQRLMPYNLEYDFAVMQERRELDSLEPEDRMHQYWGVATTEL